MNKLPVIALFFFIPFQLFSQKYITLPYYNVDSLLQLLPAQQGEERVNSLNCLAIMLFYQKTDLGIAYAEEAMNKAKELEYDKGIADAFRNQGYIEQYKGNYPRALDHYLEALSLYEILDLKQTVCWIYFDIAKTHFLADNYEKAIEYGNKLLDIYREEKEDGSTIFNVRDTVTMYCCLAFTYRLVENTDKALQIYLLIHEAMERNSYDKAELVLNAWATGVTYCQRHEFDHAKKWFHKALAYPDNSQNTEALKYRSVSDLGDIFRYEGEIDSALYYYKTAYKWYNDHGFLFLASAAANNLGYTYYEQNALDLAEKYFHQSQRAFKEMLTKNSWYAYDSLKHIAAYGLELYYPLPLNEMKVRMWEQGGIMYYNLYKINHAKQRVGDALTYYIAYTEVRDTLNLLLENTELIDLQTRYEAEQKEKQIAFLARENEFKAYKLNQSRVFIFGLTGLLVVISMLAVIIIRMYKMREQQKNLLLQQKLLRSQMNPHFLFNSLVSIQNFIINQEPAKAGKYLSKFAKLVRSILDSSFREFVTLEEELDTIENYLELQKVRYSDKFEYSMDIDQAIDAENMLIPPMLAQPIIENAIEHGIKYKEGIGRIDIRLRQLGDWAMFEVEDDGVGRQKAQEILMKEDKDHKSMATAITKERIAALNRRSKRKITMEIIDLKHGNGEPKGTVVRFGIPVA